MLMNSLVILSGIFGILLLLVMFLRVSSIFLFLALASGLLLAQYIAVDTSVVLEAFLPDKSMGANVQLILLLLPVLLTLIILRKTVKGRKVILHFIPWVITLATLVSFVMSYLPGGVRHNLQSSLLGRPLNSSQNVLISMSVAVNLFLAFLVHKPGDKSKKH